MRLVLFDSLFCCCISLGKIDILSLLFLSVFIQCDHLECIKGDFEQLWLFPFVNNNFSTFSNDHPVGVNVGVYLIVDYNIFSLSVYNLHSKGPVQA